MKKIPFGTNPNNKKQSVFIAMHTRYPIYMNYKGELSDSDRQMPIPLLFMINRWDGRIGFPGGFVDPGENLLQAAVREISEEVGAEIPSHLLQPVVSHEFAIVSHLFSVYVPYVTLVGYQRQALFAPDLHSEVTGTFLTHIMHGVGGYQKGKGFASLLNSSLAPSVREELLHLVIKENLLSKGMLLDAWKTAGFKDSTFFAEFE